MSDYKPEPLVVTEDAQGRSMPGTRCGAAGWLVFTPSTGPALGQDLVQRGIFWRKEDAVLFAAGHDMRAALEKVYAALNSDPPDGGPQKDIMGDGVIYRLDGQAMYQAINVVRDALAKAKTQ